MPLPPDFAWQERWNAWLDFIFTGDDFPWDLFPEGWKVGDPLPFGVEIRPDVVIPPDFNPNDHPPEFYIPGYTPVVTPPESGAIPPLYVEPFEPGPAGGSFSSAPLPFDIGELLVEKGVTTLGADLGDTYSWSDLAAIINTWMHVTILAIDIQVGKVNYPKGKVHLEIWQNGLYYTPSFKLAEGTSNYRNNASLPEFSLTQDYIRFLFTSEPTLILSKTYSIVVSSTNEPGLGHYCKVGVDPNPSYTRWVKLPSGNWASYGSGIFSYKIWGIAL
jgi:hypothetical protein